MKLVSTGEIIFKPQPLDAARTVGAGMSRAHWHRERPGFDPNQRAFYYVRVLEIPTPRWTAYDAKRFGLKVGEEVRMTTQERACTSPIWYTPK